MVHHYLARLDPDGPEPDPTEGRRLTIAKHADGAVTGRFELDAVGGEKVQAALESIVQANRPAGRLTAPAPSSSADALVQWADNTLAAGNLPILRTVKPHVVVTIGLDDLVDPATGPGAATDRLRRPDLRRPRPLAGLRRQHHPDRHRPRRASRWTSAAPSGSFPPHMRTGRSRSATSDCVFAGCDAPTHWCDVHHS